MTTSDKRPSRAEKQARNLALMDLNFEGLILRNEDAEHFEEKLQRPCVLNWVAAVLNRRSQRTRIHHFYNHEFRTLDNYTLSLSPDDDSPTESETTDANRNEI